jgi:hypothetical protein
VILDLNEPIYLSALLVLNRQAIIPTSIVVFDVFLGFLTILAHVVYPPNWLRETACPFLVILTSNKVIESFLHLSL